MSILKFRLRIFKSDVPPWRKCVSAPEKLSDFFKNHIIKKQWFQFQKPEKYLKSKNDTKRLLGAFDQVLWVKFKLYNPDIKEQFQFWKRVAKFIDRKGISVPPKRGEVFQKKNNRKSRILAPKIWEVPKVQKWS